MQNKCEKKSKECCTGGQAIYTDVIAKSFLTDISKKKQIFGTDINER